MKTRIWLSRVLFVLMGAYGALYMSEAMADVNRATFGGGGLSLAGGTVTGPILFPDGTAGAPSMAFASDADGTGTGFYRQAANVLSYAANGTETIRYSGFNTFLLGNASTLQFGSSADLIFGREAAATFQLGADVNGAAVDQTISCADAITGADISGADCTHDTGTGMGTGTPSSFIVRTPTIAAAGANAQSLAVRLTVNSTAAAFTGPVTSSAAADLGWTVQAAANQACTTTCTSAAVLGFNTAVSAVPVGPSDATADLCLCAGGS